MDAICTGEHLFLEEGLQLGPIERALASGTAMVPLCHIRIVLHTDLQASPSLIKNASSGSTAHVTWQSMALMKRCNTAADHYN